VTGLRADPRAGRSGLVRWGAFAVWAATVWLLSSRSDPKRDLHWPWEVPDKLVHGLVFAVGGALACAAFRTGTVRSPALAAILCCAVWGFVDEIHQGFVPGRSTEVGDLLADVTGATAGALFVAGFSARRGHRARPSR
jgi:VanZ family protein